jgi:hypothetical protein
MGNGSLTMDTQQRQNETAAKSASILFFMRFTIKERRRDPQYDSSKSARRSF